MVSTKEQSPICFVSGGETVKLLGRTMLRLLYAISVMEQIFQHPSVVNV